MKNKFSLLVSGAAVLALMACSSLEVSNPEEENFPAGWSTAAYIAANPDLRALQIMDQVAIMNTKSGVKASADDEAAFATAMEQIAVKHAGFAAGTFDPENKGHKSYINKFNISDRTDELTFFDTMELDSNAIAQQYIVYGKREGRPFRLCGESDVNLIAKGECQSVENFFDAHLYCSKGGVSYCIDCSPSDECPSVITPVTPASSSAAADPAPVDPESSSAVADPVDPESSSAVADPVDPESSSAADTTPVEP